MALKKAVELVPESREFHLLHAQALRSNGQVKEANQAAHEVLKKFPDYANALPLEVETLLFLGKPQQAVKLLQANEPLLAESFESHIPYVLALACTNQFDTALDIAKQVYKRLEQALDNHVRAQFLLIYGLLEQEHGDVEHGKQLVREALKYDPNYIMSRMDSWSYCQKNRSENTVIQWNYGNTFNHAHESALPSGLNGEFGVRFGTTLTYLAQLDTAQQWHGFDSFEGLPESWNDEPEGAYTTLGQLPDMPDNVKLHMGWFNETLPPFVAEQGKDTPIRLLNIDCDIYSSTVTVLEELESNFTEGSVVVFDEYICNKSWRDDEYKAWQEFIARTGWEYEYLSFNFSTKQAVVRLTGKK